MKNVRFIMNLGGKSRYEQLEGREHLVVPAVMIVEGVLNGSAGPLFYSGAELGKAPSVWNHKPLVVYHPAEGASACDPHILNTRKVGVILNTTYKGPKLKTEAWIDVARCCEIDKRIIENLVANKAVEISTGLGCEIDVAEGEFAGVAYKGIVRNFQPDHLAILPDQVGACSLAAGAGLLRNADGVVEVDEFDRARLHALSGAGVIVTNLKSYGEITTELYSLLQAREGYNAYIEAVFDSWFVYRLKDTSYKLSYTSSDQKTTIGDSPEEVYRSTSYLTLNQETLMSVSNTPTKETLPMSKKLLIDSLVANGAFEEADRVTLEVFSEEKLTKLVANTTKKPEQTPPTTPAILQPVVAPVVNKVPSIEETLAGMHPEVAASIRNSMAAEVTAKSDLADKIVANKSNIFTKAHLMTRPIEELKGMVALTVASSAPAPVLNYAGAQGGPVSVSPTVHNEAPLPRTPLSYDLPK